jgi:NAD-dependent deacetylase
VPPAPITIPEEAAESLRRANSIAVLTGAGISAESGIPTFRDAQTGIWAHFRPEELATPRAFAKNPRLVWEWYAERREKLSHAEPNRGHLALVEIERRIPAFTLATQNIDGLHARAGNRRVLELHGNITRVKCFEEDLPVDSWTDAGETPPRCPRCGGRLRPDVVWFEEPLPADVLDAAEAAARACDVFLCVGTSATVYPAAALPLAALLGGAVLIDVNPEPSEISSRAHYWLRGPSARVLPALVRATWQNGTAP